MIPTAYDAPDLRRSQAQLGAAIAGVIAQSGLRRVVNLSSVGAELAHGTGPIVGLHEQEGRLDALPGLDLLHLRPGYFMENHLQAAVVVRELVEPTARGVLHLHAPRHYTFQEAATILGRAIDRPDLGYVQAGSAEARAAMLQAGFSADAADQMEEMARWLSAQPRTRLPGPVEVTPTTLEAFASRFRQAYASVRRAETTTSSN